MSSQHPLARTCVCVRGWNSQEGEDIGVGQILGGMMAENLQNLVKSIRLLVSDAADQSGQS